LWVTPQILTQLSSKAPDFWSWRGGVFRFVAPAFVSDRTTFIPTIDSSFKPESTSDLPIDELLEQAAQIAAKNPNSPALATLFDRLGQAYRDRIGGNGAENRATAIEYFQRALAIQGKLNLNRLNTLARLANLYRRLSNWNEAEALYLECLKIETELCDRAGMAFSWDWLGYIARRRGNYDEAEALYNQSLTVRIELDDRAGMATSWGSLGDIARNRGDYDKAEALYHQSLEVRTEIGDRAGMASSWGLLGDIARNRGEYDKAEALYHQCLEVRTEIGDRAGTATSWGCLGETELGRGNLDAAETWLKKALTAMEDLQMTWHIAETNWDLAQLYRAQGDEPQAQQYYSIAHDLFIKLGAKGDLERIEKEWI
jgi:tetratricopeptide (TPR) repeat protein